MYLAYNKDLVRPEIQAKASQLQRALRTLADDKIIPFFDYIRDVEERYPSDARLKTILKETHYKFAKTATPENRVEHHAKMSQSDKRYLRAKGKEYPAFQDLMEEAAEDDNLYPSRDWAARFWNQMSKGDFIVKNINQ